MRETVLTFDSLPAHASHVSSALTPCFEVDSTSSLRETLSALRIGEYAAVVLNMESAPLADVLSTVKQIRSCRAVPTTVLMSNPADADVVAIFEAGAVECLASVVPASELRARIKAVVRWDRSHESAACRQEKPSEGKVEFGDLHIDVQRKSVTVKGKLVHLARREFELLLILARNYGRVVSRETIAELLWGVNGKAFASAKNTDVCINRLRVRLGERVETARYLHSVYGVGIKLEFRV